MDTLLHSLNRPPPRPGLVRARPGADQQALETLSRDEDIMALISTPEDLALLWDICQLPDYRKIASNDHADLIAKVFEFLVKDGHIPQDWFAGKIKHADKTDGTIDTLASRISYIRTWTFIANRAGWLEDQAGWQARTRKLEDKLSDALHHKLTARFVDRRTSVLMKRLREKEDLMAAVTGEGDVIVEGETIGALKGFVFLPQAQGPDMDGKALRAAANAVLSREIPERAARLVKTPDSGFSLDSAGGVIWENQTIARVKPGETILTPIIEVEAGEHLLPPDLEAITKRVQDWLNAHIATRLEPLVNLHAAQEITGLARGVAFQITEHLGLVDRQSIADDIKALDQDARGELRKYGVRFGAYSIYMPALLKPAAASLRRLLWALFQKGTNLQELPEPPGEGLTSVKSDPTLPKGYYEASGFRLCGLRAVRVDMLERLADEIRPLVYWKAEKDGDQRPEGSVEGGGFTVTPTMMSFVGCSGDDFAEILRAIGFRAQKRKLEHLRETGNALEPENLPESKTTAKETRETASTAGETEKPETAEPEEKFIEIWRPAPTRKHPPRHHHRKKAPGKDTKPYQAKSKPPRSAGRPAGKKPGKKPDPNSPFAALQALKQQMEKPGK
jgi:ATP-dependent RNA helicase SUPV3L1/SUV3